MISTLKKDIRIVFDRDPAAKSVFEVVLCYPGLHALWIYRVAHYFYKKRFFVVARLISHIGRFLTGIEIHPGAKIGSGCFIDHGSGIVIGETTIIGENVTLYQGVTLGGTGKEKEKRHPTIGNNVVVACGAKVLGSFTVGDHARIGAGSVVLKEVPPYATVVGIPGRIVLLNGEKLEEDKDKFVVSSKDKRETKTEMEKEKDINLAHDKLPDPEFDMMEKLKNDIMELNSKIAKLEEEIKKGN